MKKTRKSYDLEYKKRVVSEYLAGTTSAEEIARREGLERFQIYSWKSQLERRGKTERFEELTSQGSSPEDVRRVMELEEEIEAYKAKVAEQALMIDLLKKVHPSFQSEKKSSGYAELRQRVFPFKRRLK